MHDKEPLSDHKFISIDILEGARTETEYHRPGYCTKRANWTLFCAIIVTEAYTLIEEINGCETTDELELIAKRINESLVNACDRSMPRKKIFKNTVPWWTPELTELRKETNRTRRRFQRCANERNAE